MSLSQDQRIWLIAHLEKYQMGLDLAVRKQEGDNPVASLETETTQTTLNNLRESKALSNDAILWVLSNLARYLKALDVETKASEGVKEVASAYTQVEQSSAATVYGTLRKILYSRLRADLNVQGS